MTLLALALAADPTVLSLVASALVTAIVSGITALIATHLYNSKVLVKLEERINNHIEADNRTHKQIEEVHSALWKETRQNTRDVAEMKGRLSKAAASGRS